MGRKSRLTISVCFLLPCIAGMNINMLGDVIKDTHLYYHRGCVIVMHIFESSDTDLAGFLLLRNITRHFSENLIGYIIMTDTNPTDVTVMSMCLPLSPLYILLSSGEKSRIILEKMFEGDHTSAAAWIMFSDESINIRTYFSNIIIPFNCKFLVVQRIPDGYSITEVYRVSRNSTTKTSIYGYWNSVQGIVRSDPYIYKRRSQLDGLLMEATTIEDPLFVSTGYINGTYSLLGGYYGRVWFILQKWLNFSTHWLRPKDYAAGTYENNTWNGMIGMVISKQVEMGVGDFIMTPRRFNVIDYSLPLHIDRSKFLIKQLSRSEMSWKEYFVPFSGSLWICLGLIIFALCTSLLIAHRISLRIGCENGNRHVLSFTESAFAVLGIFCQQGCYHHYSSLACRVVLFTSYTTACIIAAAYSASLVSFLSKTLPALSFNNIEDLIEIGGYNLIVTRKTALYQYFKDSPDMMIRRVYKNHLEAHTNKLPETNLKGFQQLCFDDKYVFFASVSLLSLEIPNQKCKLMELPFNTYDSPTALIFPKNSWYKDIINYHLQKLHDLGVLYRLQLIEIPRPVVSSTSSWLSVTFYDVWPILIIFLVGYVISVLICFVEYVGKQYACKGNFELNSVTVIQY